MGTTKPTKQEIEFEVVEDEESESHASSNAKWGQVFSTYRSFYLCRAGGANPFYTVIPSDAWRTKHDDPWAFEAEVLLQLLWCLLQDEVWYDH